MKNLVIIHLESVSWEIYNQQKTQLKNLGDLLPRSTMFKHFFSSATSSIMAVCDFLHGNSEELDDCVSFDKLHSPVSKENFLSIVEKNGYRTMGIGYPVIWRDDINNFKIWDSKNPFKWTNKYENFIKEIEKFVSGQSPFVLYVWDVRSHLAYADAEKSKGKNSLERINLGYSCLDNTIGKVFEILKQKNLLENTIVAGFGDHGDEFWTHSFNQGLCHSNEPYTNMTWAPMFIYDNEKTGKNDDLISLTDLKNIYIDRLGLRPMPDKARETVYGQNLFANQKEEWNLNKSFSATNKNYHLIVSKQGLEMYAYKIDRENHNNLLNFFEIATDSKIKFIEKPSTHPHFKNFFAKDQIEDIEKNFYILLAALREKVASKNNKIQNKENLLDMENFGKIRPRNYIW